MNDEYGYSETGEVPQRRATDGQAPAWNDPAQMRLPLNEAQARKVRDLTLDYAALHFDAKGGRMVNSAYVVEHLNSLKDAPLNLSALKLAAAPVVAVVAAEVPEEVLAAVERMCQPLHESWLKGATAEADARCMATIKTFIDSLASQAQAAVSAPQIPLSLLHKFCDVYCLNKPQLVAVAESAFFAFNKALAAQAAVGVASQQPELVLALPDYEMRRIEVASDEMVDGKRYVCAAISQQEQQPQPLCNAALRAAPECQPNASVAVLTTDEIIAIVCKAYSYGHLTWAGFAKDERGHYTVPMLSQMHFDLARAIEGELHSRFRAPGGNTNDKASPDLASIASQAHKPLTEKQRGNIKLAAHTLKMNGSAKLANSLLGILSATTPTES